MENKHYRTAGRTALLSYLTDTACDTPQSAEEIYQGLSSRGDAPGRSSVYRMLSELCAQGSVRKFRADTEGETFVYQYVGQDGDCAHHLHLQCLRCGKVEHLKCDCGKNLIAGISAAHGFQIDSGRTVLYGICAACAAYK